MHHIPTDWLVLGHSSRFSRRDLPDPPTERTRHLCLLPCDDYPNPRRLGRERVSNDDTHFAAPRPSKSVRVQSAEVRHMVQLALVLQPRHKPYLRPACHLVTTVGPPIPPRDPAAVQPPQACPHSRVLR